MDPSRRQKNGFSYSNLFNLESLVNFHVPQPEDEFENHGNSSQDESRSSQGHGTRVDHCNGDRRSRKRLAGDSEAGLNSSMRKDTDSDDEDEENYDAQITEEQYRSMLGEHVQKYRRVRFRDSSSGSLSARMAKPHLEHGHVTKMGRFGNDYSAPIKEETPLHEMEISPQYYDTDYDSKFPGASRFASVLDSVYLDIGNGITYRIPPTYDKLVTTLKLPSLSEIRIEEQFLEGNLDLRSLAALLAADRRFEARNRGGLGEPIPQYESLQARIKAISTGTSPQKFTLQVCDNFSIPEGAAGRIRRSIMSESGTLQVYFVKVLEKGDTYEIIERSLPKKQIVKKDPSVIEKEEMEKIAKVWLTIVRRDIPKHHRIFTNFHKKQLIDAKRFSEICQREVKLKAELRKKEEREAAEALKREEELREAKRQQQRLNFLLSQTELYSHFMQHKSTAQPSESLPPADGEPMASDADEITEFTDIEQVEDDDPEEAELRKEALKAAQHAVSQQKMITNAFDSACLKLRQDAEPANDSSIAGSSNIDLLNPSTMPITSSVQTPEMFKGSLKGYQLKGLQWLVNCYEQGLNGILADEMGLGKTIQAMAFLAHLAEEKNIWGPFLVVAPASVLNNWADEVSRFCPDLKTLPYWGGLSERTVLRKNINPKRLYRREAGFHILITSYPLLVTDEKYLRRVKWQYMVLDEAQAIKSASSIRWKTLLSFNCRNRLLLTGTPIQNNMAELWALLHFIMPTLFDSHEQFNEWFSKGIENHAEHGGTLNEHQLNRLHAVLKPFMLRRVKKDVITELTAKTEVTVHCKLSSRQQAFYQAIKNKISIAQLFDGSRGHLNDKKLSNLMNIVIQLRKVCNHPELFERNEGSTYLHFGVIPNSLLPPPFGELEDVYYSGGWNPIAYKVPKLVYQEIIRTSEMPCSMVGHGIQNESFEKLFNIFSPDNIYCSLVPQYGSLDGYSVQSGTFGFSRLINLSPVELSFLAKSSPLERSLFSILRLDRQFIDETVDLFMKSEGDDLQHDCNLEKGTVRAVARMLMLPTKSENSIFRKKLATGPVDAPYESLAISHQERFMSNIKLLRATYGFISRARAPPINAECPDRSFSYQMFEDLHHPWVKKKFVGFSRTSEFNGPRNPSSPHPLVQEIDKESHSIPPILELTYRIFGSSPPMQSFDPAKMLTDSGKLQTLDILLKRLRAENHRVLLFAQMTKMLNILEDYMNYRKYKYFRLDGSSAIMDRRDMVREFQRRNDIFVFLLSTRAGGLGINLTAADTVIFYENDWNPTLDLQAMDRAHRLGQTKEVTVYRLICKETIEEKILQRASQKNTVQQLVMTGGHVEGDILKQEDVVSLLIDDAQLEQKLREIPSQAKERQKKKKVTKGIRIDADGEASLEDFGNPVLQGGENEQENGRSTSKKRKSRSDKQNHLKPQNSHKSAMNEDLMEMDEPSPLTFDEDRNLQHRPKRARAKKSSNAATPDHATGSAVEYPQTYYDDNNSGGYGVEFPDSPAT
ncbi:hypothetical protein J5N97_014395 [Dioscorea zingiberensis]|uniref:Chromatin-remodeling ATPase INO80 n=1 Tax=Dioscorea zingiberensis TaxID=325984 RepID=A0A9D5CSE0_9LILI|nr:hypothetical protein J5N97_014395 [Dioscorea zingiberensis]